MIVANRSGAHGLAIRDNRLYLAAVKQLFVADIKPDGRLGRDRDTLLSTMNGHVIAKGELVGLYSQATNPAP